MNQFFRSLWKGRFLLILVFPVFYFFTGLYFKLILEDPSLRSMDPDYAYFISGLNISEGIFKITHIDHPGTPLQYLIALVIRIVHSLRGNSELVEDVLGNSDLYLTIVNIIITLIVALTLFIAGKYVYKKTNSVLYAMLVQTVPFVTYIWYEIIGRITPELLMPLPIVALTVLLIFHVYEDKEKFDNSQLIIMSFILAFGLSLKLTLIPILIIPLIIVKPWKAKLWVILLSVLFFLVLALPATLQIERFWHWTKNLFLHSGNYGSGEKNVVDFLLLKENFRKIIHLQKNFSNLIAISSFILLVAVFWFRNRANPNVRKKIKVTFAVLLTIVVQALMVGKHYSPHYFIPAVMFAPLLIFLTVEILKEFYPSKLLNAGLIILLSVYLFWLFNRQLFTIGYTSGAFQDQIEARQLTRSIANTFEAESVKIIVSQDYGSPFPEYALHFSTVWSAASARERYREILGKLFPNTYQYTTWDGKFIHWGEPLNLEKIVAENIPVYIYLEKDSEELYRKSIDKIFPDQEQFKINALRIFTNSVNGEVLIKLKLETAY